jgi:NAD(P)H-hydrate repair Nnr-like enzyme with NAD(P)H-hydrate epimerase domain
VNRWAKLPKKSRRKCGELVIRNIRGTAYVVACDVPAGWEFKSRFVRAFRCHDHKTWMDQIVEAARKTVPRIAAACR